MNTNVVTRFAPSPTGSLHVGGARTALFNWLYARNQKGKFILRIEDTDLIRSTKKSVDSIFKSLEWLKIDWDEGPYFQSQRYELYYSYLQKLIKNDQAYYCNCSKEELDEMREKAIALGEKPRYDGKCRDLNLRYSNNSVIRFKSPKIGSTVINDLIKGKILFENYEQDDFIILRSDNTPTYNFVVVIDDIEMNINTVIRGDDHIMNTPKQILIYNALKHHLPSFAHVPMVLGRDKSRLSKRHGATSVDEYKEKGYLPDAFINYLVRLGWSLGNQEFFRRDELIEKFEIKNIGRSASIFDENKLKSLNAEHIRSSSIKDISNLIIPFMQNKKYDVNNIQYLNKVLTTLQNRNKTLCEMADSAYFYYNKIELPYKTQIDSSLLNVDILNCIDMLLYEIKNNSDTLSKYKLEEIFKLIINNTNIKFNKIAQILRIGLTDSKASPSLLEIMEILDKNILIERIINLKNYVYKEITH